MKSIIKQLLVFILLFSVGSRAFADRVFGKKTNNKITLNLNIPSNLRNAVGFNLKTEVIKVLADADIKVKNIKHYIESPYMKERYRVEFVEQEVWVKNLRGENICITQSMFESHLLGKYDIISCII